jgi:hypothetical protein
VSFPLENVYPYVIPSAKSVGPGALDQAIISAADELLRTVRLWTTLLDPVTPVVGQSDYVLPAPADSQVIKLEGWAVNGVRQRTLTLNQAIERGLEPGTFSTADFFDGPTADGPADALAAWQVTEGVVRISPAPTDVTALMTFHVNLTVLNGATTLPDVLLPYVRLLGYGALASLQIVPGKDYSNPQLAGVNAGLFDDGVGTLAIRTARAFGRATVRRRARAY